MSPLNGRPGPAPLRQLKVHAPVIARPAGRPGEAAAKFSARYGQSPGVVVFDDVFVPEDMSVGGIGNGWAMVTSELAFERSGPDRFMSTYPLLIEAFREIGESPNASEPAELGRLVAHLATLRRMSTSIAGMLNEGKSPVPEAALVKDLGTTFEQSIPELTRRLLPLAQMQAPCCSIRGGTREILRGMIARGLGLR